ncbi:MAG TPA: DUF72 domain-containing protein [Dehalococcoidales bacterium]|nr:DUF72 domain-containing protein [Dehalococcoidales bacterium]
MRQIMLHLRQVIYLGTSGFSYKDWVGEFYPAGLQPREWLSFYAREFKTCEINATFYNLPTPAVMQGMANKTGADFLFAIKANQEMTHRREGRNVCEDFRKALEPLERVGKLGCVLAQFPTSFDFNNKNWEYLAGLRRDLSGLPLVVEFRNARWLKVEVFQWLRRQDIGFCCVDEPRLPNLMPPVAEATGKIAYVRFHGRNKEKWWQYKEAWERYDYSYKSEELKEWLPRIKKLESLSEKTFIFANNHWKGQSITTIRQLQKLLA